MTDRSEKHGNNPGDIGVHRPHVSVCPSAIRRQIDRYIRRQVATHAHLVTRRVADGVEGYCAVVQDTSGLETDQDSWLLDDVLWIAEPKAPQVDKSMFVLVPESVKVMEGYEGWPTSMRQRLQPLDECVWTRTDAPDLVKPGPLVEPAVRSGVALAPSLSGIADGEAGVVEYSTPIVDGELEDDLIERGAEIMDRLAENDRPVQRDRFEIADAEDMLHSLRFCLIGESVVVGLVPGRHLRFESVEMIERSIDLEDYPAKGIRISLQDLILAHMPKDDPAQKTQPHKKGAEPTAPHRE